VAAARALLPLVAALAVAGEPLTATPWDIRRDAQELLDELIRAGRAADGELLQRALALGTQHGDQLVAVSATEALPIATVLAQRLGAAGLDAAFAEAAEPAVRRRLAELLEARAGAERLAALARAAPGTPTALAAWRRAADLAWDRGRLRLYLEAAPLAGDAADPARAPRPAAALALVEGLPAESPPALDVLEPMWRVELASGAPVRPAAPRTRRERVRSTPGVPAVTACGAGAIVLSDGLAATVVDHLVGAQLGSRIPLGQRTLPPHVARPEAVPGGAVAVGLSDGRIALARIDAGGAERWRAVLGADGVEATSAPIAIDGLVAVAYRIAAEDRLELRIAAARLADGSQAWDVAVCGLATSRWGSDGLAAPALTRHARGLAVCANAGAYALVGSDGQVRRLWSYPTRAELEGARGARRGLAASDGHTAVMTPADHAGLVLVVGPDDSQPRAYRGDGADGDVLAVQRGEALLAGRQVALIDTTRLRLRWTAPLRLPEAHGSLAEDRVLVAGSDQVALLDRRDGRMLAGRALAEPSSVAVSDGILLLAETAAVRGFGDARAFLARLRAAAEAAADDPRPHAALGSVLAGRGETDAAIAAWRRALELGAGQGIALRMARALRGRIDGPAPAAAKALAELETLAPHLPGLGEEIGLWRARLAENAFDLPTALAAYRSLLARPDGPIALADGLAVSAHVLAAAGVARCGGEARRTATQPAPAAPTRTAWSAPVRVRGSPVAGGGLAVAFASGVLQAWELADGSQRWSRRPERPLLGVQPWREPAAAGVAVAVLRGGAGEAAGLRDGDALLTLNGQTLEDFDRDLRPRVQRLGIGAAFAFEVRGADGNVRTVSGILGGEPMEPIAADADMVLARTTLPLTPRASDLRVFAIDARTGADLWTQALSPDEDRNAQIRPLLAGGVALCADGPDLIAIARDGAVRWRLPGRATALAEARRLDALVWLPATESEGQLLDPASGLIIAVIPAAAGEVPAADGDTVAVRGGDGRTAIWDLGRGRLRARTAEEARPLALRADALLAIDARGRPAVLDTATGQLRRVVAEGMVETSADGPADAFLALARPDRRSLAAVARDGMGLRWSLDLPAGTEVAELAAAGDGCLATLREGKRTWALLIDASGRIVETVGWDERNEGAAVGHPGGALAATGGALRALGGQPQPEPEALRATALPGDRTLRDAMAAAAWRWTAIGGARIAVARHGPQLVVAVQGLDRPTPLRVADLGGQTTVEAGRAVAMADGARAAGAGGWTMTSAWNGQADGIATVFMAWTPLPSRTPGAPLGLQLGDPEGRPWWLLAGWTRILDPP
jgi:hypothetical protein